MSPGLGAEKHLLLCRFHCLYLFLHLCSILILLLTISDPPKMTYVTYYGTADRYYDPSYASRILITTFGTEIAMSDFANKQQGLKFSRQHERIKSLIGAITAAHTAGRMSLQDKIRRLREDWIPATELFVAEWGLHMVVYDVRKAIGDVRSHLLLPAVVWPKIILVDGESEGVVSPGNVDEFGKAILDENGMTT